MLYQHDESCSTFTLKKRAVSWGFPTSFVVSEEIVPQIEIYESAMKDTLQETNRGYEKIFGSCLNIVTCNSV